ncbi:ATP-binding cassette domain-containing protein [Jongsikchunia kroppenstedtii]|uniref:ATP-binding cassette domain-containing protein n=1 Tax=Jongsikchunia kroppenstedtii TaxID=1121721 RepID=UPI00037D25DF|nr:ATP-binding cassette domain-containing protein [Jongsikchunia kroppenstedtii]
MLSLESVTIAYADTVVVDGLSLQIGSPQAPVTALLGPSGSGKSTVIKAIAGLVPLRGGRIAWDGTDVTSTPPHRRDFGVVFQDGQLLPGRTVAANIGYGLKVRRWSKPDIARRTAELLELTDLAGLGDRRVEELSGGQAQRVALARALGPRPRLLLLDEPLSALDRELRDRLIVDTAQILRTTRTPALLVTHDHTEAAALADRVAVIADGALLQEDSVDRIWQAPVSERAARFLGYTDFIDADVDGGLARTPIGAVPAPFAGPMRVALRPESVAEAADGSPATVLSVSGLPVGARARVRVGDVDVPATLVDRREVGDRVTVSLVAERAAVLPVREVVAGAVIRDGRLLLARRTYPPEVAGLWELPGGKVHDGESRVEALRRELREELAIEVRVGEAIGRPVPIGADRRLVALAAELIEGEPTAAEHSALRWVDATELAALEELVPADATWVPALAVLLKERLPG